MSQHLSAAPYPDPGDLHGPGALKASADASTSLKWGSDGELSPVDLQRVLARLTDPSLTQCDLEHPQG